jgi:hypothetical protein
MANPDASNHGMANPPSQPASAEDDPRTKAQLIEELKEAQDENWELSGRLLHLLNEENDVPSSTISKQYSLAFYGVECWIDDVCVNKHFGEVKHAFQRLCQSSHRKKHLHDLGLASVLSTDMAWQAIENSAYGAEMFLSLLVVRTILSVFFRVDAETGRTSLSRHAWGFSPDQAELVQRVVSNMDEKNSGKCLSLSSPVSGPSLMK